MKKVKATLRPEHHSQFTIEGGELFALEGIGLGVAGGWWCCHQFGWHWLVGVLVGVSILAGFMWLVTMTLTRMLLFALNAFGGGLLAYLLATALFRADEWTGAFIGLLTAAAIAAILIRRFDVFRHDLKTYQRLREEQENQTGN